MKIWDPAADQEVITLKGRSPVAWSPDGRWLATRRTPDDERQAFLIIFDVATRQELRRLTYTYEASPFCAAWSPDGTRIATGSVRGTVNVRDLETGRVLVGIPAHVGMVRTVTWSPDGRKLASVGDVEDRSAKLWDATTGKLLRTLNPDVEGTYGAAVWSPDGRRLATSIWGTHKFVEVWDTRTWERIHRLGRGPWSSHIDGHHGVAWSPRGDRLAAGNGQGEITVWDAETGRELVHTSGHTANIRSIAWSADGRRLATGSEDRTIKIWDAASGSELLTLRGQNDAVYSLAWSPDGRRLASAGNEAVKIWEAPPER